MASFDMQSGMRGAQAGMATGNPYVAAAAFVVGGFVGGILVIHATEAIV